MNHITYPEVPAWLEIMPVRPGNPSLSPTLQDIDSHLAAGHPYRDGRHITWAHETTHGINAEIRNQRVQLVTYGGPPPSYASHLRTQLPIPMGPLFPEIKMGEVNGFYLPGNRGIRLVEPQYTLAKLAKEIPEPLRGISYQTYLVDQQRYWDQQPLYIFDEWSAYLNGLTVAVELKGRDSSFSDVLQTVEFMGYAWSLIGLEDCWADYPNFLALRDFACYQTARTLQLVSQARDLIPDDGRTEQYLQAFQTCGPAETLKSLCGMHWYVKIFEDREFEGIF